MIVSFRTALILRMAAMLLVAVGCVGLYTYIQVSSAAKTLSNRVIGQTASLIDQRIGSLLTTAERQAAVAAGLTQPTFAPEIKQQDSDAFKLLAAQLLEILRANDEFAAVTVVLDKSGNYVQVSQTPTGTPSVRTYQHFNGKPVLRTYSPFGNRLSLTGQDFSEAADLRQESGYVATKGGNKIFWTPTVTLQNLPDGPSSAVTCSRPILSSEGQFRGVVSITLTLADLSRFLNTVKVSPNGFAALFEVNGTEPRLIAEPRSTLLSTGGEVKNGLINTKGLVDPLITRLAGEVGRSNRKPTSEIDVSRFRLGDQHFFTGIKTVSGEQRPRWALGVIVPENDFLDWSKQTTYFFVSFGLIAAGIGALVAWLIASRVSKPLKELARETARIRALEFSEYSFAKTNIREIDELSSSVESLKTSLRSLEKLVPAEYARWLISSGQEAKLGGERRHITTFFGDIVGFTRLSHELPPEELVLVLSEYLDVLSTRVLNRGGTLDKFNGDDVMAFWGAPTLITDHAFQAVSSAIECLHTVESLHTEWRDLGRPTLSVAFGIATGDVIVGNVGSKQRMNYTVIGDSVNLASRLQGLNKFYGTHILISHMTANELEDRILCRLVDVVAVFGRPEPASIYEPLAFAENAPAALATLAKLHNEAMENYKLGRWTLAANQFEAILDESPSDGPSAVLLSRCRHFISEPPPENWDGAFSLTLK